MKTYFYALGNDWITIYANTRKEADQKFRAKFPDRPGHEGILNHTKKRRKSP